MAHTKSGGSTKLGRDSAGKRLGIKINHNQAAGAGEIIIRQRGTKYVPSTNVKRADDDTLYAAVAGIVKFSDGKKIRFDRTRRFIKKVSVVPEKKA